MKKKTQKPTNEPAKAVIYARYSSHSQTEQSIEGQLRDNHDWAARNNVTVISEYIDRALSGTKDDRPEFQRMIEDAAKGQFSLVIVWKLDRFARNRYDSAIYKNRLAKFGVKVISVKENITDSPEGIILEGLLESMAEYYSANLSQNIRRGQRETIAKGNFCGGTVPLGYKSENQKLVPDEKYVPVIRYMFEHYAAGESRKEIIDALNARGIRSRSGKLLTYQSFSHTLANPAYFGQYVYSGEVVPGVITQPIIDEELFNRVRARANLISRTRASAKTTIDFQLTGKIYCGLCGSTMAGDSGRSRHGSMYYYYNCNNRKNHRACNKKPERKDEFEQYVVEQTLKYILTPSRAARVARAVVEEYKKEFSGTQAEELEKAIARIETELEKLVDAIISMPKSAQARIAERMEALEAQKSELQIELARLRVAANIQLTEAEVKAWLKTFTQGDPTDQTFRSRIIDVFINSIYVYENRVIIFYNIKGGKQVTFPEVDKLTAHSEPEECSDSVAECTATASESEPFYVFVNGVFGIVFPRNQNPI